MSESYLGKIILISFTAMLIFSLWLTIFGIRFQQENPVLHLYEMVPEDYEKKYRVQPVVFYTSKLTPSMSYELFVEFHELDSE